MPNLIENVNIADQFRYIATDSMVLSEVFKDYRFKLGGNDMTSDEVFASDGMLPLISKFAMDDIGSTGFSADFDYITIKKDEGNLFVGASVSAQHPRPHHVMTYLLYCIATVKDMSSADRLIDFSEFIDIEPNGIQYQPSQRDFL